MPAASVLKVARSHDGYCLRVEGAGTMRESRAAEEFVSRCVGDGGQPVAIDLSACRYLDSTFLGCLVALHRRFNRGSASGAPAVNVAAPSQTCRRAFETSRMDTLLAIRDELPVVEGEWVELPAPAADEGREDLARHIIECHRQLADLGGPSEAAFRRIADAFERELQAKAVAPA
jgi:anti-anti-sigma regulatory factor